MTREITSWILSRNNDLGSTLLSDEELADIEDFEAEEDEFSSSETPIPATVEQPQVANLSECQG